MVFLVRFGIAEPKRVVLDRRGQIPRVPESLNRSPQLVGVEITPPDGERCHGLLPFCERQWRIHRAAICWRDGRRDPKRKHVPIVTAFGSVFKLLLCRFTERQNSRWRSGVMC